MRSIVQSPPIAADGFASPIGGAGSQMGRTRFCIAWTGWYPSKTVEELAARARVPLGTAKHALRGSRKLSARLLQATIDEIMRDQR